ncbi:sigma-70 family RNA polymerase sigma factor [Paenibacillus sp. SN-8-1]|uniref:sigma-70 family RNA polymerase sigma factor n=1 Tax=Paenibacillus sp. SN-8-1 TaxID=3435409 RepID=UPI003D9A9FE1
MQELEQDIILARKGNKEAFVRLIKANELSLYNVARSILKQDENCADAIQETILKAYRSIHTLKEPAFFKTWMFRILINECNTILRREKKVIVSDKLLIDSSSMDRYGNIDLQKAIEQLEETLRLVVTLHYYEDISLKGISEILGTPEGTVKSRLHRARQILAEFLEGTKERKVGYESY